MNGFIQLDLGKIPKGNFEFLLKLAKSEKEPIARVGIENVYKACLDAERSLRIDYANCAAKLRKAIEAIGYDFEIRKRAKAIRMAGQQPGSWDELYSQVNSDYLASMKGEGSKINIKSMILDEMNRDTTIKNSPALLHLFKQNLTYSERNQARKHDNYTIVVELYALCSEEGSHFSPLEETSRKTINAMMQVFHQLVYVLYHGETVNNRPNKANSGYDWQLTPYGDYYPIPKSMYASMELIDEPNMDIYVSEGRRGVSYYLLKNGNDRMTNGDIREEESLHVLWRFSRDNLNNVLRKCEPIGEGVDRKTVYSFPGRPVKLTSKLVKSLSRHEQDDIILGMIRSVASLHGMNPPMPHRALNPNSFYVCKTKEQYNPILVQFKTIKDLSDESQFTMFKLVEKNAQDLATREYIAPEFSNKDDENAIPVRNLMPMDIFSLGMLMIYVYQGELMGWMNNPELDEKRKALIAKMTNARPSKRLPIAAVEKRFMEFYKRDSIYAMNSVAGTRSRQEDACYVSGTPEIGVEEDAGTAENPTIIAVFDGMGGGPAGERISRYAAETLERLGESLIYKKASYDKELQTIVCELQKKTGELIKKERLSGAGTTVVMAVVDDKKAQFCNVGDSRAYVFRNGTCAKVTEDDRYDNSNEIYQYLGVPESEGQIQPHFSSMEVETGDIIMLCSDGLSDVVSEEEMLEVLENFESDDPKTENLMDTAAFLTELAMDNGSKDNISVILYAVC